MVAVHLLEHLHHVGDAILWCVRLGQGHQLLLIRSDARRQPHGCAQSAVNEMRGAMRKSVAAKRGSDLGHDSEVRGGIGKGPAGHWIGRERERNHADDRVAIAFSRGAYVKGQHRLPT